MVETNFALEQFRKVYGQMFVDVKLENSPAGGFELVGYYNKPRFKRDWVPNHFCRLPVRCVRSAFEQPHTATPAVTAGR
jgi:hypothetical protein